jgi:hypothetical protein
MKDAAPVMATARRLGERMPRAELERSREWEGVVSVLTRSRVGSEVPGEETSECGNVVESVAVSQRVV